MHHRAHTHVTVARDIMIETVKTLRPDTGIFEAIEFLLHNGLSGAPVVGEHAKLVGVLSELDCLHLLATDGYSGEATCNEKSCVADFMSEPEFTISLECDIYSITQKFFDHRVRRLPVVSGGILVGMVSRGDVLRAIQPQHHTARHYPDYPADRIPAP